MSDNVFEDDSNEEESSEDSSALESKIEALKNKGIDELAKGKAHADQFIEFLKEQNAAMKAELDKRTVDEQLEELKKRQTRTEEKEEPTSSGLAPEDIKSLVKKAITEENAQTTAAGNMAVVDAEVKKVHGDRAADFIANKAKELGLTKAELGGMAARSPNAFFSLVGMGPRKANSPGVTTSTVNAQALGNQPTAKQGTYKWYQELRAQDKTKYFSPDIQQRLFKDRERLGAEFYN